MSDLLKSTYIYPIVTSVAVAIVSAGYMKITGATDDDIKKTAFKIFLIVFLINFAVLYFANSKEKISSEPFHSIE